MSFKKTGVVEVGKFSEQGLLEEMETKYFDNAVWAKIFEHNSKSGTVVFASIAEVLNCNTTDKYSRLYLLNSFKATDGKLELLLEYPDNKPNQYNRWKQTNAPQDEYMPRVSAGQPVTGYEAIHIDWTGSYWGGLERNQESVTTFTNAYLDGSTGHNYWYYAIGPKSNYQNGVPGPSTIIGGRVQLWVRIDTLPDENMCRLTKNKCLVATDFYEI